MSQTVEYKKIEPGSSLPAVCASSPYRAVIVVDAEVTAEWRVLVSDWLVRSGCLYVMAWGKNCSAWDDSVDEASIAQFFPAEPLDDRIVMTTWHEREPLEEVFWFAKNSAIHPTVRLERTVLVHISFHDKERFFQETYDVV
ncbi:DUF7684 family protein [Leeia oryzae]|uniref:DUF7684 family protein n=1 Tax=Leeia oryzae TaxID=356662 RepID=UPI00052734EF|nr:hypothetical protein [Leeia oryzae]